MAFTVNTFLSTTERTQMQVIASYVNMIPVFLGGMIPVWFLTGEFSRIDWWRYFSGGSSVWAPADLDRVTVYPGR